MLYNLISTKFKYIIFLSFSPCRLTVTMELLYGDQEFSDVSLANLPYSIKLSHAVATWKYLVKKCNNEQ